MFKLWWSLTCHVGNPAALLKRPRGMILRRGPKGERRPRTTSTYIERSSITAEPSSSWTPLRHKWAIWIFQCKIHRRPCRLSWPHASVHKSLWGRAPVRGLGWIKDKFRRTLYFFKVLVSTVVLTPMGSTAISQKWKKGIYFKWWTWPRRKRTTSVIPRRCRSFPCPSYCPDLRSSHKQTHSPYGLNVKKAVIYGWKKNSWRVEFG